MKHVLDARNLICPMPVICAQERVARLAHADELEVLATDPGALQDIPAWCRVHGHELLSQAQEPGLVRILLRVNHEK